VHLQVRDGLVGLVGADAELDELGHEVARAGRDRAASGRRKRQSAVARKIREREKEREDARKGLVPRRRLGDEHVPRDKLECVVVLDERLGPRRHLDGRHDGDVAARAVEVHRRRLQARQGRRALDDGERVEQDGELVVVGVARLGEDLLLGWSERASERRPGARGREEKAGTDLPQRLGSEEAHLHAALLEVPHLAGDGRHELDEELLPVRRARELRRKEQLRVHCEYQSVSCGRRQGSRSGERA